MPTFTENRRAAYHASLATHQIRGKGTIGLGLPVVLISSDNPYLTPGARGVLVIIEQGTDLSANVAVFHKLDPVSHKLGPPVRCRNPVFVYAPVDHRTAQDHLAAEVA
jgi:hypothetical protein